MRIVYCVQALHLACLCEHRSNNKLTPFLQDLGWLPIASWLKHFCSFNDSLSKYLLSTYCAPGPIARDLTMNESPVLAWSSQFSGRAQPSKHFQHNVLCPLITESMRFWGNLEWHPTHLGGARKAFPQRRCLKQDPKDH